MPKPPQAEKLFIDGPTGRLEALLERPPEQEPVGNVVVCHPHPQHGGTMHNKVAHTLARAISRFATGLTSQPSCPWLIVQGDLDELVDIDETVAWVDNLEPGPELLIVPGGEHFFHGRLVELRDAVVEFVERSQA